VRYGGVDPFRPGSLRPITETDFFGIELQDYADLAYTFMRGIPGRGGSSGGFQMMDPETLKNQRWTYVKYWLKRLSKDWDKIVG
jgi:hypothetical protein